MSVPGAASTSLSWSVDEFSGTFDEAAFLHKLTSSAFAASASTTSGTNSTPSFNAAPFEQAFVDSLAALDKLQLEAANSMKALRAQLAESEKEHQRHLVKQQNVLESVVDRFNSLDTRISAVAHTAVRIGDRLEDVDEQKRRMQHGARVIAHFLQLNAAEGSIPPVFRSSVMAELCDAAKLVQTLQRLAADLRIPNTQNALKNISVAAGEIETRLLKEFDECYAAKHSKGMRAAAKPLLEFEGGHLTSRFIATATSDIGPWLQRLHEEKEQELRSVADLQRHRSHLYASVLAVAADNFSLICDVFPAPDRTITLLLERIFADIISSFLELGLSIASSSETFLSVLEIMFDETKTLCRELHSINADLPQPVKNAIELCLASQVDGIFCRYRDKFVVQQESVLRDASTLELGNVLRQGQGQGLPSPVVDAADKDAADAFSRFLRSKPSVDDMKQWLDVVLHESVVPRLLPLYTSALARSDKLLDSEQVPELCQRLMRVLLESVGSGFLLRVLELSLALAPEPDAKTEPDPFLFAAVAYTNDAVQAVDRIFLREIMPRMEQHLNTQTLCAREKQDVVSALEYKLCKVLSALQKHTLSYCQRFLSREQRKTDYRPRDDSVLPDTANASRACVGVVRVLRKHCSAAIQHLQGLNLDKYLTVLGLRLHQLLSVHIKRFIISNAGALLLMRDIREYHACMVELHLAAVDEKFDTLRHVANLFAVPPEGLHSLLADDPMLSPEHISKQEIEEFVRLRVDFKSARLARFL